MVVWLWWWDGRFRELHLHIQVDWVGLAFLVMVF
jgi:hypothetical protein